MDGQSLHSGTSVLLFRTRLNCSGLTRMALPLSCPLGSLHPSGTDRTNRWIRVERSSTISILMLECAEIHVWMKSFTWPVVDPHTFFYQSQKWEQQVQDHLIWQIVDQWYLLYGYPCLNVPGCTWLCLALQIRSISPEGVWTLKPYSRLRWMDGIGWTSLNACLLRAPLCGDNNHIPVTTTSSENYIQWWF